MHIQVAQTLFIKQSGSSRSNPFMILCVLRWNFGELDLKLFCALIPIFSLSLSGCEW